MEYLGRKCMCEFLGAFALCYVVPSNVASDIASGSRLTPLLTGLLVCVMIYAFGPVSGGHFNPALSFAIHIGDAQGFNFRSVCYYIVSQCAGGITGAMFAGMSASVLRADDFNQMYFAEGAGFSLMHALLAEVIGTAFMLLFGMQVASFMPNPYYAIAIGFGVAVCISATAPISGAGLNPCLVLGVNLAADLFGGYTLKTGQLSSLSLSRTPCYIVADILGGILALTISAIAKLPAPVETEDLDEPRPRKRSSFVPPNDAIARQPEAVTELAKTLA